MKIFWSVTVTIALLLAVLFFFKKKAPAQTAPIGSSFNKPTTGAKLSGGGGGGNSGALGALGGLLGGLLGNRGGGSGNSFQFGLPNIFDTKTNKQPSRPSTTGGVGSSSADIGPGLTYNPGEPVTSVDVPYYYNEAEDGGNFEGYPFNIDPYDYSNAGDSTDLSAIGPDSTDVADLNNSLMFEETF